MSQNMVNFKIIRSWFVQDNEILCTVILDHKIKVSYDIKEKPKGHIHRTGMVFPYASSAFYHNRKSQKSFNRFTSCSPSKGAS